MKFNFNEFDLEISFDEIFSEHPQDVKDFIEVLISLNQKPKTMYFEIDLLVPEALDYIQTNFIIDNNLDDGVSGDYSPEIKAALKKIMEDYKKGMEHDE